MIIPRTTPTITAFMSLLAAPLLQSCTFAVPKVKKEKKLENQAIHFSFRLYFHFSFNLQTL
jgi:hypothetical protein